VSGWTLQENNGVSTQNFGKGQAKTLADLFEEVTPVHAKGL
jgi:hypothetical protein